jgi:O-antigen ligase
MTVNFAKIANKIIEWGIIFLIVFTPLAFGTVHPWAYTVMELTICFLVIIWAVKLIIINIRKTKVSARAGLVYRQAGHEPHWNMAGGQNPQSSTYRFSISLNKLGSVKTPLNIPIILFVGLILFQLIPLPPGVLKILSPNTYQLYQTTSPELQAMSADRQADRQLARMDTGGSSIASPPSSLVSRPSSIPPQEQVLRTGSWRPISIYPHATKTELYKILAYIGIFFLIINYSPSTRSSQPVTRRHRLRIKTFITRLVITLIVVGCFESIYGLLECLSGHQYIFFRKKTLNLNFVTGTYINLNHFAAYMAIIICMSFGYLTYKLSKLSNFNVSGWREKLSRIINLIGTKAGLLSFLILIMSSSLILSGSRMGICSFITAIILMSIMISKRISIRKMLLILLPVCLMAVWIGLNPIISRFSRISERMETEGRRTQVWNDTCNLIKDFPALGTGLGTYEYAFPKYKTIKRQLLYDHTHNDYLELMSNTGFTGFFIVIAGAAYYLFMVTRLWFQRRNPFVKGITIGCLGGIAYIILHSLTDFNIHIPANALHLSIITGIMHKTITQL